MGEGIASRLGRTLIVGGGHMGQAICAGLVERAGIDPRRVTVANPGAEKREHVANKYHCNTVADAREGLPAETIVIAVKPGLACQVASELSSAGVGGPLVVSVAAGVSTGSLEAAFGDGVRVVRVMPNTPLMCGQGMSAVSAGQSASAEDVELVTGVFSSMGRAVAVPEDQLDVVTALSGSGPAYFELVAEALARSAERLGMDYGTARELSLQTMLGTAALVEETDASLPEAIAAVSTPGGTTAAALDAMRAGGIEDALDAGVRLSLIHI